MIDGDREFTTMHGYKVNFNDFSTITISKDDPENDEYDEITLDPTDLSAIYGAFIQMLKEKLEKEKIGSA